MPWTAAKDLDKRISRHAAAQSTLSKAAIAGSIGPQ
jgi:hypothetical protein